MDFDELPENWTRLPLDDAPLATGVIDLVLGHADRMRDSLLILPCDDRDAPLPTPVVVNGVDWSAPSARRRRDLQILAELPTPGYVVAVSSPGCLPERVVRGWARSVEDVLDSCGKVLLAFGVSDPGGVRIAGGRAFRNGSLRPTG